MPAKFIAWYSPIVATAAFLLALYVALRDRSRVEVSVVKDMIALGDTAMQGQKYVVVTVANAGRRPVSIKAVAFQQKKEGSGEILLGESVRHGSVEILEGRSHSFMAEQAKLPLEEIKSVTAYDVVGKKWKKRVKLA